MEEINETSLEKEACCSEEKHGEKKMAPQRFWTLVAGLLVVIFLLAAGAGTAAVYTLPVSDPLVRRLTTVFPYPIALVGKEAIRFHDLYMHWDAASRSLAQEREGNPQEDLPDVSPEELLDVLVQQLVLRQLAQTYGLSVSSVEVTTFLEPVIADSGSDEAFWNNVHDRLGWDKETFIRQVAEPFVLGQKTEEAVKKDSQRQAPFRQEAEAALARIRRGEDFEVVASQVNKTGEVAGSGEDFVSADVLPAEIASAAAALEKGAVSDVVETADAFFVLRLIDRGDPAAAPTYRLEALVVEKVGLNQVMSDELSKARIRKWLKT
ncbi:MAG TPA: peptidyl-prolyl cis-trans isomerase [Patescibacteria group bacterium]|nr:peptidyl-prolyl cis-trans isomerase [Patescibacteria group bacterium]